MRKVILYLRIISFLLFKDPILLFKEVILRRILKRQYVHKGYIVRNREAFVFLYLLLKKRDEWEIEKKKNAHILVNRKYNLKFYLDKSDIGLYAGILGEDENPLELGIYKLSEEEIKGKTVLDVGGYLGETAIGFVMKGARKVTVYEPIFYEIARKNVELNDLKDKVEIRPYGVADREGEIYVSVNYGISGLSPGSMKIKLIPWEDVLKERYDIAKVDCEGCEYYLLAVSDDLLKRIPVWIIEIHGVILPLINKFKRAGFRCEEIARIGDWVRIYKFLRTQ